MRIRSDSIAKVTLTSNVVCRAVSPLEAAMRQPLLLKGKGWSIVSNRGGAVELTRKIRSYGNNYVQASKSLAQGHCTMMEKTLNVHGGIFG